MRRTLATLAVLLCTTALASGCAGEDDVPSTEPTSTEANSTEATPTDPASSSEPSEPTEPAETEDATQQIEITIAGNSVTPNGDRVEVAVGEPIELIVESDQPGEIHVHSTPEQSMDHPKGTTTLELDPIERPGVVDVESHTLEKTIVQLEAR